MSTTSKKGTKAVSRVARKTVARVAAKAMPSIKKYKGPVSLQANFSGKALDGIDLGRFVAGDVPAFVAQQYGEVIVSAVIHGPKQTDLLERARAVRDAISDEENAAIIAAARSDPDAQPNLATKRGRPKSQHAKVAILLRLDPEVVDRFKASGSGWQTRMNAALRKAVKLD